MARILPFPVPSDQSILPIGAVAKLEALRMALWLTGLVESSVRGALLELVDGALADLTAPAPAAAAEDEVA